MQNPQETGLNCVRPKWQLGARTPTCRHVHLQLKNLPASNRTQNRQPQCPAECRPRSLEHSSASLKTANLFAALKSSSRGRQPELGSSKYLGTTFLLACPGTNGSSSDSASESGCHLAHALGGLRQLRCQHEKPTTSWSSACRSSTPATRRAPKSALLARHLRTHSLSHTKPLGHDTLKLGKLGSEARQLSLPLACRKLRRESLFQPLQPHPTLFE